MFQVSLLTASAIALFGFFSIVPIVAAEPRPDAAIKTKIIEASVFLDDKIKADAALSADCLAEGKKWIDKNAAEADASRKEDPQFFRDGGWTFERKYTVRSVTDGHYVSIVRSDYMDTRAAHPNSGVDTILWDATQKKRISIRPFFTETADNGPTMKAMLSSVIASLNIEKKKRDATETATAEWYKSLEPKPLKIGAVTLAPSTISGKSSGLTFHNPAYAARRMGGAQRYPSPHDDSMANWPTINGTSLSGTAPSPPSTRRRRWVSQRAQPILRATANSIGLVQKIVPIPQGAFRILINRHDDCLDVVVTPAFVHP